MKIYIILEGNYEREIRGVTLSNKTANQICNLFSHLGLFVEEYETLDDPQIINLLKEEQ